MRNALLTALLLLASACSPTGAISGRVIVGPGHEGLAVFAVLWERSVVPLDDGSTRVQLTALGQTSLGIATASGGTFDYQFFGLTKGVYVVGAYADKNDDRDITSDERFIDINRPIEIDPEDATKQRLARDLFVGVTAPGLSTVTGVLHMSSAAQRVPVELFALSGPLNDAGTTVVASLTPAPGTDVPFTLFNLPPGPLHLLAQADVGNDGDASNDLYALYAFNPITTVADRVTSGVDVWLDREAPEMGVLAGRLMFNAPLSTLKVQLLVLAAADAGAGATPVLRDDAAIEAIVSVDARSKLEVPFRIPSLRRGAHFLAAVLETTDADGSMHRTSRVYMVQETLTVVDTERPAGQEIAFSLGVGRCSGTIRVKGAPPALSSVAVFVLVPGPSTTPGQPGQPVIRDSQSIALMPNAGGEAQTSYQIFGLEDGTYDLALIPDLNGDGSYQSEYEAGRIFNGTPMRVTVLGGGRVGSDFDLTFSSP